MKETKKPLLELKELETTLSLTSTDYCKLSGGKVLPLPLPIQHTTFTN